MFSLKEYGLVPVDSIRSLVYILRGYKIIPLIADPTFQKKQLRNLHHGEFDWSSQMLYVNRCYHCRGEVYDWEESVYFSRETAGLCYRRGAKLLEEDGKWRFEQGLNVTAAAKAPQAVFFVAPESEHSGNSETWVI